jgi:hypothetical protein
VHAAGDERLAGSVRFVQFTPFARRWDALKLGDADLRELELEILRHRKAPVIPGAGGLRKWRYSPVGSGMGKSGALRVGFADYPKQGTIALVVAYTKGEKDDLTPPEKRAIATVIREFGEELAKGQQAKRKRKGGA